MNLSMSPDEMKLALQEYYGEHVTNLVCHNSVLNRECIRLEKELTEIKAKLHQVQKAENTEREAQMEQTGLSPELAEIAAGGSALIEEAYEDAEAAAALGSINA